MGTSPTTEYTMLLNIRIFAPIGGVEPGTSGATESLVSTRLRALSRLEAQIDRLLCTKIKGLLCFFFPIDSAHLLHYTYE